MRLFQFTAYLKYLLEKKTKYLKKKGYQLFQMKKNCHISMYFSLNHKRKAKIQ